MAVGDIYRVTLSQLFAGQLVENVFNYLVLNELVPSAASDLVANLGTLVAAMNNIQSVAVTNIQFRAVNLMSFNDFSEVAVTGAGAITGDYEATFLAWKFKLLTTDRSFHNGSKAIAGIPSSSVSDGAPVVGVVGALAAFASEYAGNVVSGGTGDTYTPVIYRLPDTGHPFGQGAFNGGATFTKVGPLKTRQIGRGI
jgi:hypothetical protein